MSFYFEKKKVEEWECFFCEQINESEQLLCRTCGRSKTYEKVRGARARARCDGETVGRVLSLALAAPTAAAWACACAGWPGPGAQRVEASAK